MLVLRETPGGELVGGSTEGRVHPRGKANQTEGCTAGDWQLCRRCIPGGRKLQVERRLYCLGAGSKIEGYTSESDYLDRSMNSMGWVITTLSAQKEGNQTEGFTHPSE